MATPVYAAGRGRLADLEVEVRTGGLGVAGVAHEGDQLAPGDAGADHDVGGEGLGSRRLAVIGSRRVVVDVDVVVGPAVGTLDGDGVPAGGRVAEHHAEHGAVDGRDQPHHLLAHEVLTLVGAPAAAGRAEGVGVGDRTVDGEHDRLHDRGARRGHGDRSHQHDRDGGQQEGGASAMAEHWGCGSSGGSCAVADPPVPLASAPPVRRLEPTLRSRVDGGRVRSAPCATAPPLLNPTGSPAASWSRGPSPWARWRRSGSAVRPLPRPRSHSGGARCALGRPGPTPRPPARSHPIRRAVPAGPPQRVLERLHGRRRAGHPPRVLRSAHRPRTRVARHRLQLPRRPLRRDLGGTSRQPGGSGAARRVGWLAGLRAARVLHRRHLQRAADRGGHDVGAAGAGRARRSPRHLDRPGRHDLLHLAVGRTAGPRERG